MTIYIKWLILTSLSVCLIFTSYQLYSRRLFSGIEFQVVNKKGFLVSLVYSDFERPTSVYGSDVKFVSYPLSHSFKNRKKEKFAQGYEYLFNLKNKKLLVYEYGVEYVVSNRHEKSSIASYNHHGIQPTFKLYDFTIDTKQDQVHTFKLNNGRILKLKIEMY